jgi:hypothetical protein
MKLFALAVLIAVLFSLVPLRVVDARPETDKAAFVTLDVCRASDAGIQTGTQAPFLCECPYSLFHITRTVYQEENLTVDKPFLILSEKDRPPEF